MACPPSAGYRLRKLPAEQGGLAVAALVLFFLVLRGIGRACDRAARRRAGEPPERAVERAELLQREGKRGEAWRHWNEPSWPEKPNPLLP